jgi:hypothetical protein
VGQITTALKTIQGICTLYSVGFYIDLGERIAVYNALSDSFHVFKWAWEQYVWDEECDTIPNWVDRKVILSCTKLVVPSKLEKYNDRSTAA